MVVAFITEFLLNVVDDNCYNCLEYTRNTRESNNGVKTIPQGNDSEIVPMEFTE